MSLKVETPGRTDIEQAKSFLNNDGSSSVKSNSYASQLWHTCDDIQGAKGYAAGFIVKAFTVALWFTVVGTVILGVSEYNASQAVKSTGFNPGLKNYTHIQGELAGFDEAGTLDKAGVQARNKLRGEGVKARNSLANRVIDLTKLSKTVDEKTARARVEAAKTLVSEGLQEIGSANAQRAVESFMSTMRKSAVDAFIAQYSVETIAGDIEGSLDKQAEDLAKRGIFSSKAQAKAALLDALASVVKTAGKEAVEKRIEQLADFHDSMDQAIKDRIALEQAEYSALETERDALFKKPEKEDVEYRKKGKWENGELNKLEVAFTAAEEALDKVEKEGDELRRLGVDFEAMRANVKGGNKVSKDKSHLTRAIKYLSDAAEKRELLEKAEKALNKAEEKFIELTKKMVVKEDILGDKPMKDPDENRVKAVIENDNDATIKLLGDLQKRAVAKSSSVAESDLRDQLQDIELALGIAEKLQSGGDLAVEDEDDLRAVEGLLANIAAAPRVKLDSEDDVLKALASGNELAIQRLVIELETAERRIRSQLSAAVRRSNLV